MRMPIHSGRAIETTSHQLEIWMLVLQKAGIGRNSRVMCWSNACLVGCRSPFLRCSAIARFQQLGARRMIKKVKSSHDRMPRPAESLDVPQRWNASMSLEYPSNDDFLLNDFDKELAVRKILNLHISFLPDSPLFGKFHANPSGRQTNPLFLVHRHARIVSLQQGSIHSLSLCILNVLLARLDLPCEVF